MKIAIDCRMIESSGIGVFLRETLRYLVKSSNTFILIGSQQVIYKNIPELSQTTNTYIIECSCKPFSVQETFMFPSAICEQINRCDIYYTPFFNVPNGIQIPIYITIHDIIFPDIPELTSRLGLLIRMWFYRRAYKKAQAILTVSHFSEERIKAHLGTQKPIYVVYSAVASYLDEYTEEANIQKQILFVGNIKKHKGLAILIPAFRQLRKQFPDIKLVIVGSAENFRSHDSAILDLQHTAETDGIHFTGYINDTELRKLYTDSAVLVQPSFYEGFGLPPLEAMYCGTPAIISDIPVFKEIYASYPVDYFQCGNISDLYEKMYNFFSNIYPKRISLTDQQKQKYSFSDKAQHILNIFSEGKK